MKIKIYNMRYDNDCEKMEEKHDVEVEKENTKIMEEEKLSCGKSSRVKLQYIEKPN